jgi:hypothetical protein
MSARVTARDALGAVPEGLEAGVLEAGVLEAGALVPVAVAVGAEGDPVTDATPLALLWGPAQPASTLPAMAASTARRLGVIRSPCSKIIDGTPRYGNRTRRKRHDQ